MKVTDQWMVRYYNQFQILVKTESDSYFITSAGAFGQRDMTWIQITGHEANTLLNPEQIVG